MTDQDAQLIRRIVERHGFTSVVVELNAIARARARHQSFWRRVVMKLQGVQYLMGEGKYKV